MNHYLTSKSWLFDPLVFEAFSSESSAVFKRGKGHLERHKRQLIKDASVHRLLLGCTAALVRYYWKLHQTETHAVDCALVKVCSLSGAISVRGWKNFYYYVSQLSNLCLMRFLPGLMPACVEIPAPPAGINMHSSPKPGWKLRTLFGR